MMSLAPCLSGRPKLLGRVIMIATLGVGGSVVAAPKTAAEEPKIVLRALDGWQLQAQARLNRVLLAQGEEPSKPSGGEEPAKPGAGGADEPGGNTKGEPEAPTPAPAATVAKTAPTVQYGAGFHLRALFVHRWFLSLFLDESTSLNSVAFGGEFIRRKGNFDLVASIDFGFYSPPDGNYLGSGKDPKFDTDYTQFRDLNILAFAVHFIWHHEFLPWLSLVYGAGVGLGIVLGDIYRISNDPDRCNRDNAGDENQCYPKGVNPATREEDLLRLTGGNDSPQDPHLFKEDDVWPVIPVVHLLVGLNFKISQQFSVRLDGGWRDAFYVGATGHYFF